VLPYSTQATEMVHLPKAQSVPTIGPRTSSSSGDLTQARAGDWLAQDEYDAEVSKLISCAAAVTIHASPSAADASPKPNLLRKEPDLL
jgi:hypothetical protein